MKRLGAYLPDTALSTRALVFQPCLERPLIRFGLLEGAARGRGANLPHRFYRPLGEAVSPPSSAKFFTSRGSALSGGFKREKCWWRQGTRAKLLLSRILS